jgi:hypothetical protein
MSQKEYLAKLSEALKKVRQPDDVDIEEINNSIAPYSIDRQLLTREFWSVSGVNGALNHIFGV